MIREIKIKNASIKYELQYKKVKNVNLRIRPDGSIYVSADRRVPQKFIDEFIITKSDFILSALKQAEERKKNLPQQYFSENELKEYILTLCRKIYPYFDNLGVEYPQIVFKKMVSRWGSCQPQKGTLTFNTQLMYAPPECIIYVVMHEYTHFLQPNHSYKFYDELEKICPDWKECRSILKNVNIRGNSD